MISFKDYFEQRLGSSINVFTNEVEFSGLSEEEKQGLLTADRLPLRLLLPIMHEFTHFWCFNSPVGRALTILRLHVIRRSVLTRDCNDVDFREDLETVVHYTIDLLNPFAEGLSTIVESIFCPMKEGQSSSALTFFAMALAHYFRDESDQRCDLSDRVRALFKAARLDTNGQVRRSDLFCSPAEPTTGRSHFVGYSWTKDVVDGLLGKRKDELELILKFLRAYIYEDWELVALLLDTGPPVSRRLRLIERRIKSRLAALSRPTYLKIDDYANSISRELSRQRRGHEVTNEDWEALPGLDLEPTIIGGTRIMMAFHEADVFSDTDRIRDTKLPLGIVLRTISELRELFLIARMLVSMDRPRGGKAALRSFTELGPGVALASQKAFTKIAVPKDAKTGATLFAELYYSMQPFLIKCYRDPNTVYQLSTRLEPDADIKNWLTAHLTTSELATDLYYIALKRKPASGLAKHGHEALVWKELLANMSKRRNGCSRVLVQDIKQKRFGIRSLFKSQGEFSDYVFWSSACSVSSDCAEVESLLAERSICKASVGAGVLKKTKTVVLPRF